MMAPLYLCCIYAGFILETSPTLYLQTVSLSYLPGSKGRATFLPSASSSPVRQRHSINKMQIQTQFPHTRSHLSMGGLSDARGMEKNRHAECLHVLTLKHPAPCGGCHAIRLSCNTAVMQYGMVLWPTTVSAGERRVQGPGSLARVWLIGQVTALTREIYSNSPWN